MMLFSNTIKKLIEYKIKIATSCMRFLVLVIKLLCLNYNTAFIITT